MPPQTPIGEVSPHHGAEARADATAGARLRILTGVTFVALVAFQVWWWVRDGEPFSWLLIPGTPFLSVLPAGVVVSMQRRRLVRKWAQDNGFTLDRNPGWPIPDWDFPPFSTRRARRRRIRDGLRGHIGGIPAYGFRYTWWNNNRIAASSHYRNVFVLELPCALPRLTMGLNLDRSPGDIIHFESWEFDSKFVVQCADTAFAHAVFTPRTIDALLTRLGTSSAISTTKFEIVGNLMVAVSIQGNRPQQITDILTAMHTVIVGIPDFVLDDHRSPSSGRTEPGTTEPGRTEPRGTDPCPPG